MTRPYCQETDDAIVRRLFQCQMGDEEIGMRIGVKARAVGSARQRMGLGIPKGRPPAVKREEEPLPPNTLDPNSPVMIARRTLGTRLTEARGCFHLDGTPIRFFDLMREVNRVRAKAGLAQCGPNEWRVP
jgi:hypothetical protein